MPGRPISFISQVRAHPYRLCWLLAGILALMVSLLMLYAAWQHNPQQEFHSPDHINWRYFSILFGAWYLVCLLIFGLLFSALTLLLRRLL